MRDKKATSVLPKLSLPGGKLVVPSRKPRQADPVPAQTGPVPKGRTANLPPKSVADAGKLGKRVATHLIDVDSGAEQATSTVKSSKQTVHISKVTFEDGEVCIRTEHLKYD